MILLLSVYRLIIVDVLSKTLRTTERKDKGQKISELVRERKADRVGLCSGCVRLVDYTSPLLLVGT